MFDPRHLLELTQRYPEGALAYLQILREIGGGHYFERFIERDIGPEFFERMFHPRRLLELAQRNPEGALAYLQILREMGGGHYFERFIERDIGPEFFEPMFHPRRLLELAQRNPEGALAYLQILNEMGGGHYFERIVERDMGPEFFDRMFHPGRLLELSDRRISELSFWLACAPLFESMTFNQLLINAVSEGLRNRAGTKRLLSLLPITSLADLRWLSKQTQAPELRSFIAELLA